MIKMVFPYSVLEVGWENGITFKVNGQRVKHYEERHTYEGRTIILGNPPTTHE